MAFKKIISKSIVLLSNELLFEENDYLLLFYSHKQVNKYSSRTTDIHFVKKMKACRECVRKIKEQ